MKKTTFLTTVVLALATLLAAGSLIPPGSVQGSDVSTDTDNPCAGNVITQPPPTTDDSEEVDSDIKCEFYGPGDIEDRGSQGLEYNIDGDEVPDSEDNCIEVINQDQLDTDDDDVGDVCDPEPENLDVP
jgi:hypothetical protein